MNSFDGWNGSCMISLGPGTWGASLRPWMRFLVHPQRSWLSCIHCRLGFTLLSNKPNQANLFLFLLLYVCMQGQSILHVLCGNGQVDTVAAVLKRGVDIDLLNKVGFSSY